MLLEALMWTVLVEMLGVGVQYGSGMPLGVDQRATYARTPRRWW
jgi:hypothetical protein